VLYGALINTITGVDTIVYLQAAESGQMCMPGDLLRLYADKQVVGVVSKTDLPGANVEASEALLAQEGIDGPYFRVSRSDPGSVQVLGDYLHEIERQRVEVGAQSPPFPDRAHGRQL
jgi:ethanolamine utilization protein EutP